MFLNQSMMFAAWLFVHANCKRWLSLVLEPWIRPASCWIYLSWANKSHLPLVTFTIGQAYSSSRVCVLGWICSKNWKAFNVIFTIIFLLKCWWCWSQACFFLLYAKNLCRGGFRLWCLEQQKMGNQPKAFSDFKHCSRAFSRWNLLNGTF